MVLRGCFSLPQGLYSKNKTLIKIIYFHLKPTILFFLLIQTKKYLLFQMWLSAKTLHGQIRMGGGIGRYGLIDSSDGTLHSYRCYTMMGGSRTTTSA